MITITKMVVEIIKKLSIDFQCLIINCLNRYRYVTTRKQDGTIANRYNRSIIPEGITVVVAKIYKNSVISKMLLVISTTCCVPEYLACSWCCNNEEVVK